MNLVAPTRKVSGWDLRAGQRFLYHGSVTGRRVLRAVSDAQRLGDTSLVRIEAHNQSGVISGLTCAGHAEWDLLADNQWDLGAEMDQRCPRCRGAIESDTTAFFCAQPTPSPWGGPEPVEHGRGCGWGMDRQQASAESRAQAEWLLTLGRDASYENRPVIFELWRAKPPLSDKVRLAGRRGPDGRVLHIREVRQPPVRVLAPCIVVAEFDAEQVCRYAEKIVWGEA